MAISVDWATGVITVPKADTTLIQASPIEIRELNLNDFRLALRALEASEEGAPWPDTHRHNTQVTISGLQLARVIEIINGYTVTFEDGQYAVNLTGANSNVGDVVNVNQVSVRSFNSAGLVNTRGDEAGAFPTTVAGKAVVFDPASPVGATGTGFPTGTLERPHALFADAVLNAGTRGFTAVLVRTSHTFDTGDAIGGLALVGESEDDVTITVNPGAAAAATKFYTARIEGTLDGDSTIDSCIVQDLAFVDGLVKNSLLEGTITLSGVQQATLKNCSSGVAGQGAPVIDMGGSGSSLAVRNYNGGLALRNKSGPEEVSIDLNSGQIILEATVAGSGDITIRGIGEPIENNGSAPLIATGYLSTQTIIDGVWDQAIAAAASAGSVREALRQMWRFRGLDSANNLVSTASAGVRTQAVGGETLTHTEAPTNTVTTVKS